MSSANAAQEPEHEFARYWLLVVACTLGIGIGVSSLPFYTSGLFIAPLMEEFGWSRTTITGASFAGTLVAAGLMPAIGAIVDRFGVTRPVAISLAGLSIGFVMLGVFVTSFASYVMVQLTISLIAGASTPLPYTRLVNAKFDRNRGLALGLALSGTGLGGFIAPPLVGEIIAQFGWRAGYLAVAAAIAVLAPIVVVVLTRFPVSHARPAQTAKFIYGTVTSTREFRLLGLAVLALSLGLGGLIVHFVPILIDSGRAPIQAAQIAGAIGASVIAGRLAVGFAVDRIFAPYVAAIAIAVSCCGVFALAAGGAHAPLAAALAIGFAMGAEADLIGYLVARYFPSFAYGRIYGLQYAIFLLGMSASPVWIAAVRDANPTYQPALIMAAAMMVVSAVAFLQLPPFPTGRTSALPANS